MNILLLIMAIYILIKRVNYRNNQSFMKWCYQWQIVYPNKIKSPILYGQAEIEKYIQNHNLECKYTMLLKHKHNKGFSLIRVK